MGSRKTLIAAICLLCSSSLFGGVGETRVPGDITCDDHVDISDAIALLAHLFLGAGPPCPHADRPELLAQVAGLEQTVAALEAQLAALAACEQDLVSQEAELKALCAARESELQGQISAKDAELQTMVERLAIRESELQACLGRPPPRYTIKGLGFGDAAVKSSFPTALNEAGQVVGYSGSYRAFLWQDGQFLSLPDLPGATRGFAKGINNRGEAVGHSELGIPQHAVYWAEGTAVDLGDLPGGVDLSEATAINDAGQVVGFSNATAGRLAFIWDPDSRTLTELTGFPRPDVRPLAINNAGQIVGNVLDQFLSNYRGFLWQEWTYYDLPPLQGQRSTAAAAINDAGLIVGVSHTDGVSVPTVWDAKTRTPRKLPEIEGLVSGGASATSINNHGMVVGSVGVGNGRAFISDGLLWVQDLNDLIDPVSGWHLQYASDINDRGQIVGQGTGPRGYAEAFLLTPVP